MQFFPRYKFFNNLFIEAVGTFVHACENFAIVKVQDSSQVPMFNVGVYLENKQKVGQVDEVFGPTNEVVILQFSMNFEK